MLTLALDVDGVVLDPDRDGQGHWTNALEARHGITRPEWREAFFMRDWDDVINGRVTIETAMSEALRLIGSEVEVDDVLDCWFESDFAVGPTAIGLANRAADRGCRVVLATNQEHRRAGCGNPQWPTSSCSGDRRRIWAMPSEICSGTLQPCACSPLWS